MNAGRLNAIDHLLAAYAISTETHLYGKLIYVPEWWIREIVEMRENETRRFAPKDSAAAPVSSGMAPDTTKANPSAEGGN